MPRVRRRSVQRKKAAVHLAPDISADLEPTETDSADYNDKSSSHNHTSLLCLICYQPFSIYKKNGKPKNNEEADNNGNAAAGENQLQHSQEENLRILTLLTTLLRINDSFLEENTDFGPLFCTSCTEITNNLLACQKQLEFYQNRICEVIQNIRGLILDSKKKEKENIRKLGEVNVPKGVKELRDQVKEYSVSEDLKKQLLHHNRDRKLTKYPLVLLKRWENEPLNYLHPRPDELVKVERISPSPSEVLDFNFSDSYVSSDEDNGNEGDHISHAEFPSSSSSTADSDMETQKVPSPIGEQPSSSNQQPSNFRSSYSSSTADSDMETQQIPSPIGEQSSSSNFRSKDLKRKYKGNKERKDDISENSAETQDSDDDSSKIDEDYQINSSKYKSSNKSKTGNRSSKKTKASWSGAWSDLTESEKRKYYDDRNKRREQHFIEKHPSCPYCPEVLPKKSLYDRHLKLIHPYEIYKCKICGKPGKTADTLRRHLWTHKSQKEIQDLLAAGKKIPNKNQYWNYYKNNRKLHQCSICGKILNSGGSLNRHQLIHSDERNYPCDLCSSAFKSKDDLKGHKARSHPIDPNKFQCTICLKTFAIKLRFEDHLRIHYGIKPFQCTICGKGFTIRTAFYRHKRIHLENRPRHPCEHCGMTFVESRHLKQHLKNKHKNI